MTDVVRRRAPCSAWCVRAASSPPLRDQPHSACREKSCRTSSATCSHGSSATSGWPSATRSSCRRPSSTDTSRSSARSHRSAACGAGCPWRWPSSGAHGCHTSRPSPSAIRRSTPTGARPCWPRWSAATPRCGWSYTRPGGPRRRERADSHPRRRGRWSPSASSMRHRMAMLAAYHRGCPPRPVSAPPSPPPSLPCCTPSRRSAGCTTATVSCSTPTAGRCHRCGRCRGTSLVKSSRATSSRRPSVWRASIWAASDQPSGPVSSTVGGWRT
mmetsp:Transcript_9115/g.26241  ORF Transcript_9115/g.26241 Transcript_9115/m.26241 type:complete len:271 (+) Transcript_9115:530-1342(+)